MRFRIRFADQIVGVLIIFALLVLVVAVIFLGRSQRWFARDFQYRAWFESALGISPNMEIQYRGFPIGSVKSCSLVEGDRVEVKFTIFDQYADRVTEGSLVDIQVSPIGLGNRFLFYPGKGQVRLEEGAVIPRRGTPEAKDLSVRGLTSITESSDDISRLMGRAGSLLEYLNSIAVQFNDALAGTDATSIGRIVGSLEGTVAGLPAAAGDAEAMLAELRRSLVPILENLRILSAGLADPGGTVASLLDGGGELNTALNAALASVTGILRNLDRSSEFLPAQLPQIAVLITEIRTVLHSVEGLLVALQNNPILRKGFPDEVQTQTGGTSARNMEF